ncbi:2-succinyl-5-enolpyruvyl-6-hydroxy-3-cyclohexene-1-carboxylic-acid synthase [Vibrio hangzhouensis]|uniref:2-succinyl-5-enolpyruvyl-6-hydroxy-3- cyclohexene-1-carboxylic-acid synthase n=1 Tax=Vibrio hangzhouensis TaxID=462991 RepID=UPI001C95FB65|nr:2-succinyl-5-enolpyruvyl-6-hydroxy-3-cyclohexene-1-carboxylic-acid synthase [Vibrio hangzhouensis]MBY6197697.1 2-succinyl-5-enolpyruvyl-6-hydroxy-3-cyclohexene-1-carboxylic-acid synthase [Vibrio hangzhouensis]
MSNQAALNRVWTQTLIEELYRQGVRHVCIAPGSRSTPLTLEAVAHPALTVHSHFDERGLGFLALGLAKSSDSAVAVIVTSGTAVANLLPAVAETALTKEKLILLTSDRPVELVGCGANQAIVQNGLFSQHVTHTVNLPSPTTQIPLTWLLTTIDQAFAHCRQSGGSIHVNCPFPEPLYGGDDKSPYAEYQRSVADWQQSQSVYVNHCLRADTDYQSMIDSLALGDKKGIIVVGNTTLAVAQQAKTLAEKLGWPVLLDPQTGLGGDWQHYDIWLQNGLASDTLSQANFVLQIEARLVSKRLNAWLKTQVSHDCRYLLLTEQLERLNPEHLSMTHCQVDVRRWLQQALETETFSHHDGWGAVLTQWPRKVIDCLPTRRHISEFDVAQTLSRLPADTNLFLGNSLIVRLADMIVNARGIETFSNRGASGIDGLVATASGVQRGNLRSTVLYLGDTSLLYDLNSLALFTHNQTPSAIVVTNNDGGAIFDMLPVPQEQKVQCYQMPHGYHFEHAAAQFGLHYANPETTEQLQSQLSAHLKAGKGTLLIEVRTPAQDVTTMIRQLGSAITAVTLDAQ